MMELLNGSEAMVRASIAAGCRFYAAYPMTPATKLLDYFAQHLPEAGGVCMNAESELEAVGMAWGALATGARAATGGCGQGLSLMQESFAEITLAELPLVIFNMARGQGDYYQSTRGGGHGDYRHIVLAPRDIREAVELVALAFDLADKWRNPVVILGDYLLAHGTESVDLGVLDTQETTPKTYGLNGTTSGTGNARMISPYGSHKGVATTEALDPEAHHRRIYAKYPEIARVESRIETMWTDDAEVVVAAWGAPAKFVRYAVRQLHERGLKVGFARPITLWPFPAEQLAAACQGKRRVLVFETNCGQMLDDVRLAILGSCAVEFIGDYSVDKSSFGVGPLLNVETIRARIESAFAREAAVA
jgi:2-oxoglutarate ferredoxin oxidoreductase subunit alpha